MRYCVNELRAAVSFADPLVRFDTYLAARRIIERVADQELDADGYIQPISSRYEDGFRLCIKPGTSATRMRFTAAHELCHTFFYELVPEIKFRKQEVDDFEERLCNYGASELLIPTDDLRERVNRKKPSLFALRDLAKEYGVSMEAMLLRLKGLNLWRCDLSIWHHKSDGSYALDKLFGREKRSWRWGDAEKVSKTWNNSGQSIITGWSYIYYFDSKRNTDIWKRVHVQSMNRGESVFVLWSSTTLGVEKVDLPLFSKSRKRPHSARKMQEGTPRRNLA
jgi:hypothetical protein